MTVVANDSFLTTKEAADIVRIAKQTLTNWRCSGRGPVKIGGKVMYKMSALLDWRERNTYSSTKEYGRKKGS